MDIMQMNQREYPKIERSRRREEYLAECREKIRDNVLEQIDFAREVSD